MDIALALEIEQVSRQKALEEEALRGESAVRQFYAGTTALITGGTGFIGKQLIEKLLRSCDVKRIYILMRSKKGKSMPERLQSQFNEPVYDNLRSQQPDFARKVIPVEGDISELGVGLNDEDRMKLAQEVNVIFHVAATTRFEEPLKKATFINVRGTREILELAKCCKDLRSFVHVSTAFSNATKSRINHNLEEKIYESPVPPEVMINLAKTVEECRLNAITADLIRDWPNTYCFTKAIAEDVVRTMGKDLPVVIVRPPIGKYSRALFSKIAKVGTYKYVVTGHMYSLTPDLLCDDRSNPLYFPFSVICTLNEPTPGWVDMSSVIGPSGVLLTLMLGVMHVVLTSDISIPIVPVDYVNNAVIATASDTNVRYNKNEKEIKVYNISCSGSKIETSCMSDFLKNPNTLEYATPKAVWYCYGFGTGSDVVFWLSTWLLHYIPAYVADFVFNVTSMKRPEGIKSFVKLYEKIYKMSMLYGYFLRNQWNFVDDNTVAMLNQMSKTDRILFNFDVAKIDCSRFMAIWCIGLRKFILKDGLKNSEYGRKKQSWLKIANLCYHGLFFVTVIYFLYICCAMLMYVFR
uniref:Fatty acyl-CoA reductase n=1 Tax=Bombyx mori TaxID=7091 RepID=A0A8R2HQ33_BOMMO|nr:fatty acyl-CoA reductase wat isoform X1 [Bombyx mori]XP_021208594.1 fatty acyl-CoA reductase wat isoform X1 [Bombyx mori]